MGLKRIDLRQTIFRGLLQQIFPWFAGQNGETVIASIDKELQPPFVIDATSTPSLTVNIGPAIVPNAVNGRNKSASFLSNSIPIFTSGTMTVPASSGGNITVSTGGSFPLTLPSGDYVQVLLAIDTSNNISVKIGTPNAVQANALVPSPAALTSPFGYVTLHNIGGVIQNITQNNCYQFAGSGSGSGGGGGLAAESALTIGTTSKTVTFATPQSSNSYIILGNIYNPTDPLPEYFPVLVSAKTTTDATFSWNQPIPTSAYFIDWAISPGLAEQAGEAVVPLGATSITITFPIALVSVNYVVVAEMADFTDITPQFQPLLTTNKTISTFTIAWNVPTGTANYRISWQLAAYQ